MLAERMRRRAREMTLPNYVAMMQHAAEELDAEAAVLEAQQWPKPGHRLDITV
ncbi:MAG TPA: hypothetical protein VG387_07180 [Rhizomicrobium sp.]|nr:hypothetical protein [Rhizomicrobium sp.]